MSDCTLAHPAPEVPDRYRRNATVNALIAAVPFALTMVMVWAFVYVVLGSLGIVEPGGDPEASWGTLDWLMAVVRVGVLMSALGFLTRRVWRRGVIVSPQGCTRRTTFRSRYFPWDDVAGFDVEHVELGSDAVIEHFHHCILRTRDGTVHHLPLGSASRTSVEQAVEWLISARARLAEKPRRSEA
jgi:hypothetical protein